MGKMKRAKGSKSGRNRPLWQQISDDKVAKPSGRIKIKDPEKIDSDIVDSRLSRKILIEARRQQNELEEDEEMEPTTTGAQPTKMGPKMTKLGPDGAETSSEDEKDKESDVDDDDTNYECVEVNREDERALEMFMHHDGPVRRTLADIIMEKITEKQTEITTQFSDRHSLQIPNLDKRVVEVFKGVRKILSKYRSGKLPKAFKVIPSLANWEQVLYITCPERWTAAAVYQATRIFTANLKEKMAQRYFNLVLLPRVRDDIIEYKRLNVHLYQAMKKALFKPGAFFKGFLLPLCESGTCTLREAIIVGSVVAKNSIPVLHSAAALLKIAEMEYTGANSIFLRILLDKKYALPYRVVDAIVYHFIRFQMDKRELPVLWHQAFLTFIQRYKEDISGEQKEALLELLKAHFHQTITAEIRRELEHSKCRDELEADAKQIPMESTSSSVDMI